MLNWAFFLYLEARSAPSRISSFAWTISWESGNVCARDGAEDLSWLVGRWMGSFHVTFRVEDGEIRFKIRMEVKCEGGKTPTDLEALVELLKDVVAFSLSGIICTGLLGQNLRRARTTLFTMRWRRIACLSLWGFSIGSGRVGDGGRDQAAIGRARSAQLGGGRARDRGLCIGSRGRTGGRRWPSAIISSSE